MNDKVRNIIVEIIEKALARHMKSKDVSYRHIQELIHLIPE